MHDEYMIEYRLSRRSRDGNSSISTFDKRYLQNCNNWAPTRQESLRGMAITAKSWSQINIGVEERIIHHHHIENCLHVFTNSVFMYE